MSEQTRQLAERIARDLFTGYHVNGWTEAGLMIRIEKHLRHAAGASVPQEAALREMFRAGISLSETSRGNYLRPDEVEKQFQHWRVRLTGEASSAPQKPRRSSHLCISCRKDCDCPGYHMLTDCTFCTPCIKYMRS